MKQICGSSSPSTSIRIRVLLYYRFARWLSVVLEGINPPMPKPILSLFDEDLGVGQLQSDPDNAGHAGDENA
jgi:hypothetical protein